MCGSKLQFLTFWTAHNAIFDPKNQNFEKSYITFLVHPRAKLHTKNELPKCYKALENRGGLIFRLKFREPFLAKNRYFWPILGQNLKNFGMDGKFLWFKPKSTTDYTQLARKNNQKCHFLSNMDHFAWFFCHFLYRKKYRESQISSKSNEAFSNYAQKTSFFDTNPL